MPFIVYVGPPPIDELRDLYQNQLGQLRPKTVIMSNKCANFLRITVFYTLPPDNMTLCIFPHLYVEFCVCCWCKKSLFEFDLNIHRDELCVMYASRIVG